MKINKTFKKVLLAVGSIGALFVLILLYHIITIKPKTYETPHLQISRIDFKNTIDSSQAKQICKDLRSIKGLTSDSIIVKNNVVVYFHNNSVTNSAKVYAQLMSKRQYDAQRYILPDSLANKKVCPMNQDSFTYKMSKKLNQLFN
ncbi:hypothetical protein [Flavobacterium sp.]